MLKRIFLAGFMALAFGIGCESYNPYKIAEKNINNSKQLRIGMTKAEVLTIMGEPLKEESFNQPDIWYYYFDCNWLDGLITEEECFPLVFQEGKLAGWGNNFYNRWKINRKERVSDVEVPPEAYRGEQ